MCGSTNVPRAIRWTPHCQVAFAIAIIIPRHWDIARAPEFENHRRTWMTAGNNIPLALRRPPYAIIGFAIAVEIGRNRDVIRKPPLLQSRRSEERRVGKEWRYRWA